MNLLNKARFRIDMKNREKRCFCFKKRKLNTLYISSDKKYKKVTFSGITYKDIDKWNVT